MSSKSKKKLKFLNVEKRNKLQQKLISEKQHYAEEFKRYFHECYQPYQLPVPGRPTIWITVGQGPTALAVGAGGGCLDIFTLIYPFCPLSPSLWETARYRLKYCLKGPLNPKPTNQPKSALSGAFSS